eukprot:EG_transcript_18071
MPRGSPTARTAGAVPDPQALDITIRDAHLARVCDRCNARVLVNFSTQTFRTTAKGNTFSPCWNERFRLRGPILLTDPPEPINFVVTTTGPTVVLGDCALPFDAELRAHLWECSVEKRLTLWRDGRSAGKVTVVLRGYYQRRSAPATPTPPSAPPPPPIAPTPELWIAVRWARLWGPLACLQPLSMAVRLQLDTVEGQTPSRMVRAGHVRWNESYQFLLPPPATAAELAVELLQVDSALNLMSTVASAQLPVDAALHAQLPGGPQHRLLALRNETEQVADLLLVLTVGGPSPPEPTAAMPADPHLPRDVGQSVRHLGEPLPHRPS